MSLGELICLGLDAAILTIVYKFYRDASKSLRAIKEAPSLDLTSDLKTEVGRYAGQCIPYVVIRGTVKAIDQPIVSKNVSDVVGVIHQTILREHKLQWSWAARWWQEVKKDVSRSTHTVPFVLTGAGGLASVEVLEPMSAQGLELRTVFDEFRESRLSLWDTLTRFFIGETTTGYQNIETMLPEGGALTGVGALVLQHGRLFLQPPDGRLAYYLTQLTPGTLVKNLEREAGTLKMLAVIFGAFGGFVLAIVLFRQYERWRKRVERSAELRRMREIMDEQSRRRREVAGESATIPGDPEDRLCVVCQESPREVLILECGHLCCCAQCGQMLEPPLCPVCRADIVRLVPAFVS